MDLITCSCSAPGWLKSGGNGAVVLFILVGFALLRWGTRAIRREHFHTMSNTLAVINNLPAITLFIAGLTFLVFALLLGANIL